jgi:DNA repair photolyase
VLFDDEPGAKLIGIARLAAASEVLEVKQSVQYFELETRRFIGRNSNSRMPFVWTLNPYRGCEFGCKYCYARYAHEFMELREPELFERQIYAKRFHAASFRAELQRVKRGECIWMGTATDPYQPAERRFGITRQMLEVLAGERGLDFGITTKSDLVGRDAELLSRIAQRNSVRVNLTITTLDEPLARLLEPRAPRPALRLAALKKLTGAGVAVGVLAHPVMPLINDSEESLDGICLAAAESGASFFSAAPLFLKPCAQVVFFPFLEQHFPHLLGRYRERFEKHAYLRGHYPEMIKERVRTIRARHKLAARESAAWPADDQLELFAPEPGSGVFAARREEAGSSGEIEVGD